MLCLLRLILTSLPLISLPALAAVKNDTTGITGVGPAIFLFTIAAALILTLLFRSSASHLTLFLTARFSKARIRRALLARSRDLLADFIIPGAYGGLARIDYAVMTPGGILCVRTVHANGIVFGGEDEAQWTNIDGTRRRRFINPIIQNEGRTRAMRNIVAKVPVANLVIFTGNVEFTTPRPANVIRLEELESFVAKFVFGPSKVEDWDSVWLTLKSATLNDEDSRKDLAAQINFN